MATEADVYMALLGQCAEVFDELGFTGAAYLVDARFGRDTPQQCCVQLNPGRSRLLHPQSGAALLECTFATTIWWRNALDYADRANLRIAGDAGVLVAATALRFGAGGKPGLVGSFLLSQGMGLVHPVLMTDGGGPEAVSGQAGWLRLTDSYTFSIEFEWTTDGE